MRTLIHLGLALCLSLPLGGCGKGFSIETPSSFAEIDAGNFDYRATSAEGVVLGVRREKNDPHGNLEFWSAAIDHELVRHGFVPGVTRAVTTPSGLTGRQMRYSTTRNERPFVLWTTVFVDGKHLVVVQAGGDEAHFSQVEKAVDHAIRTLEVG